MSEFIKKFKNRQAGVYGNKNFFLYGVIAIIVLGYVFFFTSPYTMPEIKNYHYTKLNTDITLDNYTLQIGRWEWAQENNIMEVELNLEKENYTIFSKFKYSINVRPTTQNCKVKQIYIDDNFLILQITNLPNDFTELALTITAIQENGDNSNNISSCKVYTNCDKVVKVDKIKTLNKNDYIINRLKRLIKEYNQEIQKTNELINKNNAEIDKLNGEIQELQDKKIYQTQEEIQDTDSQISNIQNRISDINSDIIFYSETIAELKEKIIKSEQQLQDLM
ncbi:MAG: hypothetical protein ACI39F_02640 [Acutalibacteraceae bacterium]